MTDFSPWQEVDFDTRGRVQVDLLCACSRCCQRLFIRRVERLPVEVGQLVADFAGAATLAAAFSTMRWAQYLRTECCFQSDRSPEHARWVRDCWAWLYSLRRRPRRSASTALPARTTSARTERPAEPKFSKRLARALVDGHQRQDLLRDPQEVRVCKVLLRVPPAAVKQMLGRVYFEASILRYVSFRRERGDYDRVCSGAVGPLVELMQSRRCRCRDGICDRRCHLRPRSEVDLLWRLVWLLLQELQQRAEIDLPVPFGRVPPIFVLDTSHRLTARPV